MELHFSFSAYDGSTMVQVDEGDTVPVHEFLWEEFSARIETTKAGTAILLCGANHTLFCKMPADFFDGGYFNSARESIFHLYEVILTIYQYLDEEYEVFEDYVGLEQMTVRIERSEVKKKPAKTKPTKKENSQKNTNPSKEQTIEQ
jgi:hypothetical protein